MVNKPSTSASRNVLRCSIFSVFLLCFFSVFAYGNVRIEDKNIRHAYFRGEKPTLEFEFRNGSDQKLENAVIGFEVGGVVKSQAEIDSLETGKAVVKRFEVDTSVLKSDEYSILLTVSAKNKELARKEMNFWVAKRWNPERMRVWLWAHRRFAEKTWKMSDEAKMQLDWYADKGFNSINPGGGAYGKFGTIDENKYEVFDYGIANGLEMGFDGMGFIDGHQQEFNPFDKEQMRGFESELRNGLKIVRQFPNVKTCFLNSEYEDRRKKDMPEAEKFSPYIFPEPTKHKYIKPGVIADTDEKYLSHLYHYKWGDGVVPMNRRIARIIREYRPDMFIFADPLRKTTVYDRFLDLDAVSSWTYTNPDPKYTLFVETLIANAKFKDQGFIHTVTMLNYPGTIAPRDKGWVLMGPDRLVECSWVNLSRNPDALSVYFGSGLDPFSASWEGVGVTEGAKSGYPYQDYPESFEAFKKFVNDVVKPYGPMIKKMESPDRKVAVLSSIASRVYSASPKLVGHYPNYQVYCFYTLLNMIHVPADIVFDETIALHGLDNYDVLVLPKCDTLTETVYNKILEFQTRGGKVIADQYLRAPIPDVKKFDFDFTYRSKVSANAIIESKDYTIKTDYFDERLADEMKTVKGVTAEDDQKIMEAYAQLLRKGLEGTVERKVDCSASTALTNMLEIGDQKYLFVVNDKRTYDDRVGQYKAVLGKALGQTVTVSLSDFAGENICLYDVLENKKLSSNTENGKVVFDVDLPAPGGKIIAILDHEIAETEIEVPAVISERGNVVPVNIFVHDSKKQLCSGAVPLKVTIYDPAGSVSEFSDYYAAQDGFLNIAFTPAKNDLSGSWTIEVENLITGDKSIAKTVLK